MEASRQLQLEIKSGKSFMMYIHVKMEHVLFVFKDRKLHELATSIRGAVRHGFDNGQAKSISTHLISVLRSYCLCMDHNLCLNVYV